MKSSNIDNMFNFNPELEETKVLSPLTYYQPFQSSFDPEFAVPSAETPSLQDQMKRWRQGADTQESGSSRGGTLSFWDEEQNRRKGGFGSERDGQASGYLKNSFPVPGTSAWRPETDNRNLSEMPLASSWPSLLSITSNRNPKQSFPGCVENQSSKYFPPGDKSFGILSSFPGSGYESEPSFGPLTSNRQASAFESFDSLKSYSRLGTSGQSSQLSTGFEGSSQNPVYYPLMLGPFAKNLSRNMYRTGHTRPMVCNFCKNNKEVPDIYLNHYLYDPETKVLTCPVLRKHVCETCGGTGDRAHTLQYCPVNKEKGLQAKVPVLLKTRTITNSTGKIRRN